MIQTVHSQIADFFNAYSFYSEIVVLVESKIEKFRHCLLSPQPVTLLDSLSRFDFPDQETRSQCSIPCWDWKILQFVSISFSQRFHPHQDRICSPLPNTYSQRHLGSASDIRKAYPVKRIHPTEMT